MYRLKIFLGGQIRLSLLAGCLTALANGATFTTLYQFTGGPNDGSQPIGTLAMGAGGVMYGVTVEGGAFRSGCFNVGCGTAYSLTPPASPGGAWTEQVIWNFGGPGDGQGPVGIVVGAGGVLYGVAGSGGANGVGAVFSLSPPSSPGAPWSEQILWSFGGANDGAYPAAGVTLGTGGVLYGTTVIGGSGGQGIVFSLSPPATLGGQWMEDVLWAFDAGPDGGEPKAEMIIDSAGVLYGTTIGGGANGTGVVFALAPPTSEGGSWTEAVLYSLGLNVIGSTSPLTMHGKALYGTTIARTSGGTVFRLTPPASAGDSWTARVLHTFQIKRKMAPDGASPNGPLIVMKDGSVVGTARNGGTNGTGGGGAGDGTIFKLSPPVQHGQPWTASVLYDFGAGGSGSLPQTGLQKGSGGLLYGTAGDCNSNCNGAVFSFAP